MSENAAPVIHVTFGASAAGSLKQALRMLRRPEEVHFLADDLACGPIDPPEPGLRAAWANEALGEDVDAELVAFVADFWRGVEAHRGELIAWVSRRYATEYCGLLGLLARTRAAVRVVDVADVAFVRRDGAPSPDTSMAFAWVRGDEIVEHGLLERAARVTPAERARCLGLWQRLRAENAALRVLTATGLVSAPISYFDETIISCVTDAWRSCAHVVVDALNKSSPGPYLQGGRESFLFSRLLTLIDDDVLEGRNPQELWSLSGSWVRRRACAPVPRG